MAQRQQGEGPGGAESKPKYQSNLEFVANLKTAVHFWSQSSVTELQLFNKDRKSIQMFTLMQTDAQTQSCEGSQRYS